MTPRTVDKEARRERVLMAAATVFAERGYRGATVDQVAEAAGVAKGSVYLSFESKEDLFYAVIEDFTRDFIGDELETDGGSHQHVLDGLAESLYFIEKAVEEDESAIPLTLEFWAACGVEETRQRFGKRLGDSMTDFRGRIERLLERGKARGEVDPEAPVVDAAACIVAMVDGLIIQQWTVEGFSASRALEAALPTLLRGLRPAGGGAST